MPTYIHNVCGGISHGTHAQEAENKDKQHDTSVNIREGKRKKHVAEPDRMALRWKIHLLAYRKDHLFRTTTE